MILTLIQHFYIKFTKIKKKKVKFWWHNDLCSFNFQNILNNINHKKFNLTLNRECCCHSDLTNELTCIVIHHLFLFLQKYLYLLVNAALFQHTGFLGFDSIIPATIHQIEIVQADGPASINIILAVRF